MAIRGKLLCLLCILSMFSTAWAERSHNESAAIALQQRLSFIQSFRTQFEQITRTPEGTVVQSSSGDLWIGADASFKIVTKVPYAQYLVSDGDDFWSYEPDLYQATVAKLVKDINKVPILLFGGKDLSLLDSYKISSVIQDELSVFTLSPIEEDSLFLNIKLSFREMLPVSIIILDSLGQETRLDFQNSSLNPIVKPSEFQFTAPPGVDVIDERAL